MADLSDRQQRILIKLSEWCFGINRDYARGQFIIIGRDAKPYVDTDLKALEAAGYVMVWEDQQGKHRDHWELTEQGYNLAKTLQWQLRPSSGSFFGRR